MFHYIYIYILFLFNYLINSNDQAAPQHVYLAISGIFWLNLTAFSWLCDRIFPKPNVALDFHVISHFGLILFCK